MSAWDTLRNAFLAHHMEYCTGCDGSTDHAQDVWNEAEDLLARVRSGIEGTEKFEDSAYCDDTEES